MLSISLLPGEGITLNIPSYCLDVDATAPDEDEFFIPKRIEGDEEVWLPPLLEYAGKYPDEGLQGVEDFAVGRGFEEATDFFKGLNSGNPEAEKAFDTFKNFNKDLYKAGNERNSRPGESKFRKLRPGEWKLESNRKGPQPIALKGGY